MSSNMRTLIDMKKRQQAQEEVRYRESRLSNTGRRNDQIANIAYGGNTAIYADGGPVQGIEPKGFVPVKVSNGEFEFTPEQVANIGAAMLASKG